MIRFLFSIALLFSMCFGFDADVLFSDRVEFHSDQILILPDGSTYYLDESGREVAVVLPDGETRFAGGFGSGRGNFIDPVAIVSDGISVFVCDRAGNTIVQLNRRLEFITAIPVTMQNETHAFYPSSIAVNANGQLAVLSEEHNAVWTKAPQDASWNLVAELNRQAVPISCPEQITFSDVNSLMISSCGNAEYSFSLFGRLISAKISSDGE